MSSTSHESGSEVDELASTPATSHSSVKDGEEGNETSFSIPDKLRKARTLQERNLARVVQSELDKERPLIEAFRRRVGSSQGKYLLARIDGYGKEAYIDFLQLTSLINKLCVTWKLWLKTQAMPQGPESHF